MHRSQGKTKKSIAQYLNAKVVKGAFLVGIFFLGFFQSVQGQSIPNMVLKDGAFEAEFHFDVFYSIVECKGERIVLITAFNESGAKTNVGFDISLSDARGIKQLLRVPIFSLKQAEMFQPSCETSAHPFLKFKLDERFDVGTISGQIEFYSK